jgi:hypothetical protein
MKKLVIIALALFALQVTAQEQKEHKQESKKEFRKEKMGHRKTMDPKEMAQLQTKKMTLALDLTEDQQSKVGKLNLKNAEFKKAGMEKGKALKDSDKKLTKEEKLLITNEKLDQLIATKREMKNILTEAQYEKYSKMMAKRGKKGKRDNTTRKKGEKRAPLMKQ